MISIATTYYNRKNQFINTLKSLQKSSIKDFEVIVVDDASDDDQRIEDLQNEFKFLKVFRINKNEKKFHNPCIGFNLAFSKCSGDVIIIQNAECLHYSDILKLTLEKITNNNYLSFACYSIDNETTEKINKLKDISNTKDVVNFLPIRQDINGKNGWYNHGIYRPTGLHFCSAITKKNLKQLNGFDERYAEGNCYDDNEILHRIKNKNLQIDFINDGIVIHQYHPNFNYDKPKMAELENKNANLYYNTTLKSNSYRANPNKNIFNFKIAAFTQLRNELSKGNLENWFKQMEICDYIYIFDQNSDDGSKEYYKKFKNTTVIESPSNRFFEELFCKQELLNKLLHDHPDVDWILWLDGDLLLDGRLLKNNGELLHRLCHVAEQNEADACFFDHYNLWRSDIYYRTDDDYHSLNGNWCPLWKNNGNLFFNTVKGLHNKQFPEGLKKGLRTSFAVVHRGFATDYQIITKYEVYKSNGQNGWALDRLLNENGLQVEPLKKELLPEWFEIKDDENPKNKKSIINIYNEKNK
jgi:GT2 family glycosyltransferase